MNGISIEVVAVLDRTRRRREKMMLAINKNGAARDIDDARCRFNRVERVGERLKQLDLARGYLVAFGHICRAYGWIDHFKQ